MLNFFKKRTLLKKLRHRLKQLSWIKKKRSAITPSVKDMLNKDIENVSELIEKGYSSSHEKLKDMHKQINKKMKKEYSDLKQNVALEIVREYLPVIVFALTIKFFILGSYRVPSGSMMDNIFIGDNLFVIMCRYGLHIPFTDGQFVEFDDPGRGDIITFTGPPPERNALVKRVIGVPGDKIRLTSKSIFVNDKKISREYLEDFTYTSSGGVKVVAEKYKETNTDGDSYNVLYIKQIKGDLRKRLESFCKYCQREFIVPERKYFVMGDNRDDSSDSRHWGFVERRHLQGTPWFVWFSIQTGGSVFDVVKFRPERIGTTIK